MKIFISSDLEGTACVWQGEHGQKGTREYEEARRLLTAEVCAAVEGARQGGASEIIVADMHGGSGHLLLDQMPAGVRILEGVPHAPRFPFLDASVEAMLLVGYHAMAGTPGAVIAHTMTGAWREFRANGRLLGEVGIDAAIAGCVGVPVALVTGDDKVCAEARALLGPIQTAVVKTGLGRHRALCLPVSHTQALIHEAARSALLLKGQIKPLSFGSPVEVAITYKHTERADGAPLDSPNQKRMDGYTVLYTYQRFSDWYGGVWEGRGT